MGKFSCDEDFEGTFSLLAWTSSLTLYRMCQTPCKRQLIIRKFVNIFATNSHILRLKCTKFDSRSSVRFSWHSPQVAATSDIDTVWRRRSRWTLLPCVFVCLSARLFMEFTLYKYKHQMPKPSSYGSKKPRFWFSTVLTKNRGFWFWFGNRHSTSGMVWEFETFNFSLCSLAICFCVVKLSRHLKTFLLQQYKYYLLFTWFIVAELCWYSFAHTIAIVYFVVWVCCLRIDFEISNFVH